MTDITEQKITKTITIIDDETPVIEIRTSNFEVNETLGGSSLIVNYVLSEATTENVTFQYDMIDITTIKGTDYTEDTNRVETISTGTVAGSFTISILDDLLNEGNETFTLKLSNITGASAFYENGVVYTENCYYC